MANNRLHNAQLFLGDADPTDFNVTTLRFPGQLGGFYEKNGAVYQLVLSDSGSAIAIANGTPLVWRDLDDFVVTADVSRGVDGVGLNFPAGVGVDTITAGNHLLMQVQGAHTAVLTNGDDDIAAGDAIWVDADGTVDSTAGGTAPARIVLGIATAADSDAANTVAAYLFPPRNGA